jgi:hypothetical protein
VLIAAGARHGPSSIRAAEHRIDFTSPPTNCFENVPSQGAAWTAGGCSYLAVLARPRRATASRSRPSCRLLGGLQYFLVRVRLFEKPRVCRAYADLHPGITVRFYSARWPDDGRPVAAIRQRTRSDYDYPGIGHFPDRGQASRDQPGGGGADRRRAGSPVLAAGRGPAALGHLGLPGGHQMTAGSAEDLVGRLCGLLILVEDRLGPDALVSKDAGGHREGEVLDYQQPSLVPLLDRRARWSGWRRAVLAAPAIGWRDGLDRPRRGQGDRLATQHWRLLIPAFAITHRNPRRPQLPIVIGLATASSASLCSDSASAKPTITDWASPRLSLSVTAAPTTSPTRGRTSYVGRCRQSECCPPAKNAAAGSGPS